MINRRVLRAVAPAIGAAVGIAVAGCRAPAAAPPTTRVESSPTPPAASEHAADTEETDHRAVDAAYRQFWVLEASFDSRYPAARWRAVLSAVATDPVLTRLLHAAAVQKRQRIAIYGQAVARPTIPVIAGRSTVRVADCQDASHTGQADARTGRPRSVGLARTPVVAVMVRGADGRWRVSDVRYVGGRC